MQGLTKGIENNALAKISAQASPRVMTAISKASQETGVDFAYMVQQAKAESSFNPSVKAQTSSATGLYQFIKSTWVDVIDKYGEKHGVDTSKMSQREILDLRKDPEISSMMAAEFAGENQRFLETHWAKGEKDIGSTELYFAHFMGAGGAAAFLNAKDQNPLQEAAVLFPKAAKANYNVFYDRNTGRARSLQEVYDFFDKKFAVKSAQAPALEPVIEASLENTDPLMMGNSAFDSRVYTSMYTAKQRMQPAQYGGIPTSYQSLLQNPIDLMLMTQLKLPFGENSTRASLL